jgi:hypothetical protein
MKAKCPHCCGEHSSCPECDGTGYIEVKIGQGDLYSKDCLECGELIGGAIVGEGLCTMEELKRLEALPCPFCNGKCKYTPIGD